MQLTILQPTDKNLTIFSRAQASVGNGSLWLRKEDHRLEDGKGSGLAFVIRDKDGREVDFVATKEIECRSSSHRVKWPIERVPIFVRFLKTNIRANVYLWRNGGSLKSYPAGNGSFQLASSAGLAAPGFANQRDRGTRLKAAVSSRLPSGAHLAPDSGGHSDQGGAHRRRIDCHPVVLSVSTVAQVALAHRICA